MIDLAFKLPVSCCLATPWTAHRHLHTSSTSIDYPTFFREILTKKYSFYPTFIAKKAARHSPETGQVSDIFWIWRNITPELIYHMRYSYHKCFIHQSIPSIPHIYLWYISNIWWYITLGRSGRWEVCHGRGQLTQPGLAIFSLSTTSSWNLHNFRGIRENLHTELCCNLLWQFFSE